MPAGIQLPDPSQVGGAWGAGVFPPWFAEEAVTRGWDYATAMSEFRDWVATGPVGPDHQPIDLGWYWNSFRPGGQYNQATFDTSNAQNYTYPGQTAANQPVTPPAGTQNPDGTQPPVTPPAGTQPPANPNDPNHPPMPTAPPQGQDPQSGQWRKRTRPGGAWTWEWVARRDPNATPPPPPPPAPAPVPPPAPPPPAPTPKPVSGPPVQSYGPQAQRQNVTSPAAAQATAQTTPGTAQAQPRQPAAAAPYPPGGDTRQQMPGNPPPPAPRPQPGTGGGAGAGGGGGVKTGATEPQTLSAMNARRWNRPGGLLG